MVVDSLEPVIRHQAISNHHADSAEAVIYGMDNWIHPTEYCSMYLLIHVLDTHFWHKILPIFYSDMQQMMHILM